MLGEGGGQPHQRPESASDMPLRFTRRLSLVAGLRVNLSKGGASLSIDHRGAWYTVGPRGGRATLGLPGTGLFWTEKVPPAAPRGTAWRSSFLARVDSELSCPVLVAHHLSASSGSVLLWACGRSEASAKPSSTCPQGGSPPSGFKRRIWRHCLLSKLRSRRSGRCILVRERRRGSRRDRHGRGRAP